MDDRAVPRLRSDRRSDRAASAHRSRADGPQTAHRPRHAVAHRAGPRHHEPSDNHQILAYGYDSPAAGTIVRVYVYDNNDPDTENFIDVTIASGQVVALTESYAAKYNTTPPLRGFFEVTNRGFGPTPNLSLGIRAPSPGAGARLCRLPSPPGSRTSQSIRWSPFPAHPRARPSQQDDQSYAIRDICLRAMTQPSSLHRWHRGAVAMRCHSQVVEGRHEWRAGATG
jgi:hypothetical protein